MMAFNLKPIGIIHSPFTEATGTPIQAAWGKDITGSVELFPEFAPGLQDLHGFDRVWLIFWFDRTGPARLRVTPFLDQQERGVFATRSPCRPNPIGLSCVRLIKIEGNALHVSDLDVLDGTPLLDIKPYVPAFDCLEAKRIGWLDGKQLSNTHADGRFDRR